MSGHICNAHGVISDTNVFTRHNGQNVVKHDFFSHETPLALVLALPDANGKENAAIALIRSKIEMSCNMTFLVL